MQDKQNQSAINYEKIGLYISLAILFITLMLFLYQLKDDASLSKERIAKLEVKVEHLQEKVIENH